MIWKKNAFVIHSPTEQCGVDIVYGVEIANDNLKNILH